MDQKYKKVGCIQLQQPVFVVQLESRVLAITIVAAYERGAARRGSTDQENAEPCRTRQGEYDAAPEDGQEKAIEVGGETKVIGPVRTRTPGRLSY